MCDSSAEKIFKGPNFSSYGRCQLILTETKIPPPGVDAKDDGGHAGQVE